MESERKERGDLWMPSVAAVPGGPSKCFLTASTLRIIGLAQRRVTPAHVPSNDETQIRRQGQQRNMATVIVIVIVMVMVMVMVIVIVMVTTEWASGWRMGKSVAHATTGRATHDETAPQHPAQDPRQRRQEPRHQRQEPLRRGVTGHWGDKQRCKMYQPSTVLTRSPTSILDRSPPCMWHQAATCEASTQLSGEILASGNTCAHLSLNPRTTCGRGSSLEQAEMGGAQRATAAREV